ncbi:hypothetical protein [Streptomyces sp. AC512_CC834]|uniref:hypothetical protein n=1 Tax=Streptomyces sp. AC512_CC834 TaxID=2823691 RepID=UPI001C275644|nr:hypothetical protein [Streptomyces sp. AC512_CC834]
MPSHPQTGQAWGPAVRAQYLVPLPFGVWLWLAFPEPDLPVPTSGVLPNGALRDDFDPSAPYRYHLFRAAPEVFRRTLVRLPATCSPWLREFFGNPKHHMRTGLF